MIDSILSSEAAYYPLCGLNTFLQLKTRNLFHHMQQLCTNSHRKEIFGHHSRLRDVMGQFYPIYARPVLVLITHVINRSTLHFAVARNIVY